ncbi:SDR family oxidoreductase [Aquabacterium sp. A7-Y]|uniref:SDR family oxidoreductase n=1 Tax=Aquabacterium sp. A7-Y TaxID=1349605 RepID=UPI00223D9F4E|nr:SDR family oxidoreductase [Aquabacterium sp. A7-Y]MCW7538081.1 SDR family oxidoreductase [Aquabacterium sp. A7-Y]
MIIKAVLTGQSRGLGAALAGRLLERGIAVLGLARGRDAALALRFPETLRQVELDLADPAALAAWLVNSDLPTYLADAQTVLLINNAGTLQPVGPLPAQDPAAIARAVSLNIAAPLMLSAALAAWATGRPGLDLRIVHISSGAGRNAYPGWSLYGATKAALDHHARAAALDATPGLRICSLAPGVVDTDMQAEIRASRIEDFPMRSRFEALKREGGLLSPSACAERLLTHLLGEHFGRSPVADLRELAD